MAITDTKKNVLLGQGVEEQVKNIDDNFTSLFDTADDLNDAIKNSGYITKDVNNLTNYTVKSETGTDIELSIDNKTYVMTLKLKNASGTVVSTASIDFPIESMVVDASYEDGTLTLTLQNGTTLDVDISALISGLVPQTRKVNGKDLSADITLTQDNVGDGTTYKRYSQTEKTKLAGIAEGANKYTHPSYTAKTSGLYKITVDATGHVSAVVAVAKSDITGLGIPAQDTTYSPATESANGLMSAADKKKLNAIDDSLKNVTADQIGKVKDVKVNGSSVLGTDGVAAISIADLAAGFVSVATTDSSWTTQTLNGTTYQAIKVAKTDTALGVFNSSGQEMVVQKIYDDSYLYLCVGTAKVACTIRKLSGGAVGTGGGGSGDVKKYYRHLVQGRITYDNAIYVLNFEVISSSNTPYSNSNIPYVNGVTADMVPYDDTGYMGSGILSAIDTQTRTIQYYVSFFHYEDAGYWTDAGHLIFMPGYTPSATIDIINDLVTEL